MADTVIVGAGIVGCSTVYHQTELGADDVVVDQRPLPTTGGSSSHALGIMFQTADDKVLTKFAMYSRERYSELEGEDGEPLYSETGGIEIARLTLEDEEAVVFEDRPALNGDESSVTSTATSTATPSVPVSCTRTCHRSTPSREPRSRSSTRASATPRPSARNRRTIPNASACCRNVGGCSTAPRAIPRGRVLLPIAASDLVRRRFSLVLARVTERVSIVIGPARRRSSSATADNSR